MLEGGEDPLYVARRLVRFASEDIGECGGKVPGSGVHIGRGKGDGEMVPCGTGKEKIRLQYELSLFFYCVCELLSGFVPKVTILFPLQ